MPITQTATPSKDAAPSKISQRGRQAPDGREAPRSHRGRSRPVREPDVRGEPLDVVNARVRRRNVRHALIGAGFGAAAAGASLAVMFSPVFVVVISLIIFGVVITVLPIGYTEDDYYQIAGSRFKDGGHRCVSCGHGGIWRHSPYRSNHTVATCSNKACGVDLWKEPKW